MLEWIADTQTERLQSLLALTPTVMSHGFSFFLSCYAPSLSPICLFVHLGPTAVTATEGEVFSVLCNAKFDSDVTSASVVWDKTGRNIVNEDSNKYYVSESKPPNLKSTLHIKDVDKYDAGYYTCRATQFTPTISQFKQHEVLLRVQYKPKFPANTPAGVWIDRHEFSKGLSFLDVNFTCIVDADPAAELSWHTANRRLVEVGVTDGVADIITKENMSILRYRYRVTGEELGRDDRVSTGSWPMTPYQKPNRKSQINQPNVQFECRAKNTMGSDARNFPLRIGDLPTAPILISHSYEGNNLTLVLQQSPVDPPVDFYRIDFSDGVIVEFNSSKFFRCFDFFIAKNVLFIRLPYYSLPLLPKEKGLFSFSRCHPSS